MFKRNIRVGFALVLATLLGYWQPLAFAQTHSSSSYKVDESSFTSGSGIDSNSASYNARGSAGDLGVGESTSASYAAFAGSINPSDEYLEMVVNNTTIDLGDLTTSTTGIGVGTFYVRTYMNGSYTVQTVSDPPTQEGGRQLAPMTTAGASSIGVEQFGINLVANTAPTNGTYPAGAGSNPSLQPNSTYANGQAATGYNTPNTYKYVKGDIIAGSGAGRAWGQTNYTVTYIENISTVTYAGVYRFAHEMVVVPTY